MIAPPGPVRVEVHGRIVEIEVAHPDDHAMVAAVLGGFRPALPPSIPEAAYRVARPLEGGWTVERDGAVTHRAATVDDALLALEWQMVNDLLAQPLGRFHLHGAALADPSGTMAVLICGESGAGKTTLAMALVAAGFLPYSDDVVLIDPGSLAPVPFERAFHVDEATRALVADLEPNPDWEVPGLPRGYFLPRTWARAPLPVKAMFFPRGRGADRPLLVQLNVPDAATTLLGASGSLDTDPALALRTAARLTGVARAFALYSGALPATRELVQDMVRRVIDTGPRG